MAGTSSARMTVASSATAIAIPMPSALISTMSANANEAGHEDHDERRGGDDPAAPLHPAGDRLGVVAGPVPDLLHPRQQEDLVVHRQAEQDAEQDDRLGGLDEAERLEAERRRQVAVLEDPDEGPEAGHDRQRVHDQRLGRQDDRAEQDEQHEIGRHDDEQRRAREVGPHPVDDVGDVRGAAPDEDRHAGRRRERAAGRAQGRDQRLALVAVRPVGRVERERREVAAGRRGEGGLDVAVARPVRVAVQERVLGQRQARIDVDEAVDAR